MCSDPVSPSRYIYSEEIRALLLKLCLVPARHGPPVEEEGLICCYLFEAKNENCEHLSFARVLWNGWKLFQEWSPRNLLGNISRHRTQWRPDPDLRAEQVTVKMKALSPGKATWLSKLQHCLLCKCRHSVFTLKHEPLAFSDGWFMRARSG